MDLRETRGCGLVLYGGEPENTGLNEASPVCAIMNVVLRKNYDCVGLPKREVAFRS